jgi:tryptophan synthase alpha chain
VGRKKGYEMNRIEETFKKLKAEKRKAFIPYITAGDPDIKTTGKILDVLALSGADIIELGIPFSDPLADGPTIQRAVQRSLDGGFRVEKVMKLSKKLRKKTNVPFVFMTYYNIVFSYGIKKFIEDAAKNGIDGIIIPDLPIEEADSILKIAEEYDFCVIMLTAPTTSRARFKKIASKSRGFIYYVSLTGVTGERKNLTSSLRIEVVSRKRLTTKPVCVGFGVSDVAQASAVAKYADGVIVGSALIKIIEKNLINKNKLVTEVGKFASKIAEAVHSR